MRLLTLSGALLCCLAAGASAADFAGKWQVEFRTSSQTSARPLCTFEQKDNRISGTCKGPHSEGPASGTVKGSKIEFTWKTGGAASRQENNGQMQSGGGAWTFTGTLSDDHQITGDGTAPTGETGRFTAKRQ